MKLICAGLPKTGTKTLAKALRILGYTVYDVKEQLEVCTTNIRRFHKPLVTFSDGGHRFNISFETFFYVESVIKMCVINLIAKLYFR